MAYDVIVIGGGWSGLVAATNAIEKGKKVCLIERAPHLGGRCFSFWDDGFGRWIDNGTHVFIDAYHRALHYLELWNGDLPVDFNAGSEITFRRGSQHQSAGRDPQFRDSLTLNLHDSNILHSLINFLTFRGMSFTDRLKTIRIIYRLTRLASTTPPNPEPTISQWLQSNGVNPGSCDGFWDILISSVMNSVPEKAGLNSFLGAIRYGLVKDGRFARLGLINGSFKRVLSDPTEKFLLNKRCDVKTGTSVKSIKKEGGEQKWHVTIKDSRFQCRNLILAMQPCDILKVIPQDFSKHSCFKNLNRFDYSAIMSIHLLFDREIVPNRFEMLPGASVHWVFAEKPDQSGTQFLSTVLSDAVQDRSDTVEELIVRLAKDLRERYMAMQDAKLLHYRIINKKRATVLLLPGIDKNRPDQVTPFPGLFLAGDWTNTGLPATIEGAVLAGERCEIR